MENNLRKETSFFDDEAEVFHMVSFKDIIFVFMGLCLFFALVSFLRGDTESTASFMIISLVALVIYQAMIPSSLSWKVAITLLLILAIILISVLSPNSLEIIVSRIPIITSG